MNGEIFYFKGQLAWAEALRDAVDAELCDLIDWRLYELADEVAAAHGADQVIHRYAQLLSACIDPQRHLMMIGESIRMGAQYRLYLSFYTSYAHKASIQGPELWAACPSVAIGGRVFIVSRRLRSLVGSRLGTGEDSSLFLPIRYGQLVEIDFPARSAPRVAPDPKAGQAPPARPDEELGEDLRRAIQAYVPEAAATYRRTLLQEAASFAGRTGEVRLAMMAYGIAADPQLLAYCMRRELVEPLYDRLRVVPFTLQPPRRKWWRCTLQVHNPTDRPLRGLNVELDSPESLHPKQFRLDIGPNGEMREIEFACKVDAPGEIAVDVYLALDEHLPYLRTLPRHRVWLTCD